MKTETAILTYHPDLLTQFPDIIGGMIHAQGVSNGPTPDALRVEYEAEQQRVLTRIGDTPLSEITALAAWRRAFRKFGANPTKYRCAAEALLRRLTKKRDIPSINTLVDIGNLVSIRYALPIAVVDLRDVQGTLTVQFADGSQYYRELGSDEVIYPEAGEVVFADEKDMIFARRWCWRQSAESAARHDTKDILITIEAQHEQGRDAVESAVADLLRLLKQYPAGHAIGKVLSRDDFTLYSQG
ncbi:hypothetical protein KFU94_19505 [Chloroflexi bacterium TSY]|nr:hypothetical protein [Chloroflexi bacterium TSY]